MIFVGQRCNGVTSSVSPWVTLNSWNITDVNAQYHDFHAFTNDSRPDWYFEQMVVMRYTAHVGFVGYTPKDVKSMASTGRSVAIYNGLVYDVTTYLATGSPPAIKSSTGTQPPSGIDTNFMSGDVLEISQLYGGMDIMKRLNALNINRNVLNWQKTCLQNLFTIGKVDNRQSPQCHFLKRYPLGTCCYHSDMVAIIGFKFLASINLAAARGPEDYSLYRTLSLSRLEHQQSIVDQAIVVNEIRGCCLCTSLTRFVFLSPGQFFIYLQTYFTGSLQFANEPVGA